MDILVTVGIAAIVSVVCIGTAIKLYTRKKLKDFEGTYDAKRVDK